LNHEFLTEGSFIDGEGGAELLPQISNLLKIEEQSKLKNNINSLDNSAINLSRDES